jgi:hypothetical protein
MARHRPGGPDRCKGSEISMNIYHIWCNLKEGVGDCQFVEKAESYLDHLRDQGLIEGYRITRRKLGLSPPDLPEFHVMLELRDMAQLDEAFDRVAARVDPVEAYHHGVNSLVKDVVFALYRDFPDPVRQRGEERF